MTAVVASLALMVTLTDVASIEPFAAQQTVAWQTSPRLVTEINAAGMMEWIEAELLRIDKDAVIRSGRAARIWGIDDSDQAF